MSCPVCSSINKTEIGEKDGWHLVRCSDCALNYLKTMPTQAQLDEYYAKYYLIEKNTKNNARKISRFKRRIFPLSLLANGKKFLDIGCSTGFAVEAAHQLGFEATGIDVGEGAIEVAKKEFPHNEFHHMTCQQLAEQTTDKFDFIFCAEVIEHLDDPHSFVASIRKMLNDDGLLYLTTPDAGHFKVPKNILNWYDTIPPEHTMLYTKNTMKQLLAMHGLNVKFFMPMIKPSMRFIARPQS